MTRFLTVARKASVAAVGALASAVAAGVLPSPWQEVGVCVVALATYFGVYHTRNVDAA